MRATISTPGRFPATTVFQGPMIVSAVMISHFTMGMTVFCFLLALWRHLIARCREPKTDDETKNFESATKRHEESPNFL